MHLYARRRTKECVKFLTCVTYKEGDQWTQQKNRQVTGAKGGKQNNLKRLWVKERTTR